MNLAQSWAVRVTSSTFIGWPCHDGKDKIIFFVLSRITAAPGGQWWPESLSWLLFRQPIHEFRASLVWERYAIMITCLLQWDFIHIGWVDSSMCVVRLLLQSMQPIAVIPSYISGPIGGLLCVSHVWSELNEEDKLILLFLKRRIEKRGSQEGVIPCSAFVKAVLTLWDSMNRLSQLA